MLVAKGRVQSSVPTSAETVIDRFSHSSGVFTVLEASAVALQRSLTAPHPRGAFLLGGRPAFRIGSEAVPFPADDRDRRADQGRIVSVIARAGGGNVLPRPARRLDARWRVGPALRVRVHVEHCQHSPARGAGRRRARGRPPPSYGVVRNRRAFVKRAAVTPTSSRAPQIPPANPPPRTENRGPPPPQGPPKAGPRP
jgi:hypothetical protein